MTYQIPFQNCLPDCPTATMGSSFSTPSYTRYTNDFELVIRVTKDLDHLLETEFGAPSGRDVGLHDKITYAQQTASLSPGTVRKLRYLVTREYSSSLVGAITLLCSLKDFRFLEECI